MHVLCSALTVKRTVVHPVLLQTTFLKRITLHVTQSYQLLQAFKSFPNKTENQAGGGEIGGDCFPQIIHLSNDAAEFLILLSFIHFYSKQHNKISPSWGFLEVGDNSFRTYH